MVGSGTVRNLYFAINAAEATNDITITVRKNGTDQTLTVTLTHGSTSVSDTTHSFTVAAGDLLSVKSVSSVASAVVTSPLASVELGT
jgi:hypothetical protein